MATMTSNWRGVRFMACSSVWARVGSGVCPGVGAGVGWPERVGLPGPTRRAVVRLFGFALRGNSIVVSAGPLGGVGQDRPQVGEQRRDFRRFENGRLDQ